MATNIAKGIFEVKKKVKLKEAAFLLPLVLDNYSPFKCIEAVVIVCVQPF
jgi:hypothetical protein